MRTIKQILGSKGPEIWSVAPDDTVFRAIQVMAEKRIGALLVMEGDSLAGIISERDYAREVILQGRSSRETPVSEIMTTDLVTITANDHIESSLSLMTERRVRHLPVVDGDTVLGVLSIGDLVKEIIREQQSTIENLEHYIRG